MTPIDHELPFEPSYKPGQVIPLVAFRNWSAWGCGTLVRTRNKCTERNLHHRFKLPTTLLPTRPLA